MNEDATIKIFSKIQQLERDLQLVYRDYFSGYLSEEHYIIMIDSTEREINLYYYIYNLIIKDARPN